MSRYDLHRALWWIRANGMEILTVLALVATIAAATILLTGCGQEVRTPAEGTGSLGVTATLSDIGTTLAWAGGIAAAAGVALSFVSLFYPPLAPFAALFRFAAVGGVGVTGTGAATLWLADNLWLLALGVAASVGAVVWWYWPSLVGAWRRRVAGQTDEAVK